MTRSNSKNGIAVISSLAVLASLMMFRYITSPNQKDSNPQSQNQPTAQLPKQSLPIRAQNQTVIKRERTNLNESAQAIPNNELSDQAKADLQEMARQFAANDPSQGLLKLIELNRGQRQIVPQAYVFMETFVQRLVELDPKNALITLRQFPENLQASGYSFLASSWPESEVTSLDTLAQQLDDPGLKSILLSEQAKRLREPGKEVEALAYAKRLANHSDAQNHIEFIVEQLVRDSPEKTSQWASEITSPQMQSRVLSVAVEVLASSNPKSAAAWIEQLPPNLSTREAALALTQKWSESNPQAALRWLTSSGHANGSLTELKGPIQNWIKKDPDSALKWVHESAITQDEKTYLRNQAQAPNPITSSSNPVP